PNEKELSHRWRRRAWQTHCAVSQNQMCASRRPAVGSRDWLGLSSGPLEHSVAEIARRFSIRKRGGKEVLEHTPLTPTERLQKDLKRADTSELNHKNVLAGAVVL